MRRYLSLGVKFVFVLSIFIAGCLVFIELTTEKAVQEILSENIEVIHQEVSNSTYNDVDNFVQEVETFIQSWRKSKMMSSFLIGMSFLEIDMLELMETNPWIAGIEVVSEDGSEFAYPASDDKPATELSQSLWYQRTKAQEELIWQPAIGKSDYFRISAPLYSTYGDRFAGVCSILIKASVFEEILTKHGIAGGSIMLVNQTGAVLAADRSTLVDQELFDQHDFFQKAFESEEEIFDHFEYANDLRITFIKQIPKLKSVLLLQVPKQVAYQDVNALTSKLRGMGLFTLIGIILITGLISRLWLTRRIDVLVESADSIAAGNLNETINLKSNDELGKLATAFNTMAANLRALIQDIIINSKEVAEASTRIDKATEISNHISEQVAGSIQQVATGAADQTHYIEDVNTQLFDFSHFINNLTASSQELQNTAYSTREKADKGSGSIRKVAEQMNQIHKNITESSEVIFNMTNMTDEISNFVNIIDNIANQTNLLALNAAIEAARAGEEGRGFAVVAGEIRVLSEEVSKSAGKIRELVDRTQEYSKEASQVMEAGVVQIERGQRIVDENGTIYADIHSSVEETLKAIDLVNQMVHNLSENTTQIVAGADRIASIAQENAASAEEVAASTEEQTAAMVEIAKLTESLTDLSHHLNEMVRQFKL